MFNFDPRDLFECPLAYSACTWEFSPMYPEILGMIVCFYYIARWIIAQCWVDDLVINDPWLNWVCHRFTVKGAEVTPAQCRGHFFQVGTNRWVRDNLYKIATSLRFGASSLDTSSGLLCIMATLSLFVIQFVIQLNSNVAVRTNISLRERRHQQLYLDPCALCCEVRCSSPSLRLAPHNTDLSQFLCSSDTISQNLLQNREIYLTLSR